MKTLSFIFLAVLALSTILLAAPGIDAATKPSLTSVTPNPAPAGATITLTGTNFATSKTNTVTFVHSGTAKKTTAGIFSSTSSGKKIAFTLPATLPAGTYQVFVKTSAGESNGRPSVIAAPTLSSVSPNSAAPGATITLTGINFATGTANTIILTRNDNKEQTTLGPYTSTNSNKKITFALPTTVAAAAYTLSVKTSTGTSAGKSFTVLVPPPGTLVISVMSGTTPLDGATVLVNGENKGTTTKGSLTLTLPPATYNIRVEKEGYITPAEQTVTVESNREASLTFSLSNPTPTPTGKYLVFTLVLEQLKNQPEQSNERAAAAGSSSEPTETAILEDADTGDGTAPALSGAGDYTALLRTASPFPDFPDFGPVIFQQKFTFTKEIFPEIFGDEGITSERVAIDQPVEVIFFPFAPNLNRLQILGPDGNTIGSFPVAHLSPCNSNGACDNFESAISCPGDCGQCYETDLGNDLDYHQDTCIELDPLGTPWVVKHDRTRSLEEWVASAYEEAAAEQPIPTPSPGPQSCNNDGNCGSDEISSGGLSCAGDCFTIPFPPQQPPDPTATFGSSATEPLPGGCDACDEFFTGCTSNICITSPTASICNIQRFQQCTDARANCRTARQCSQQYTAPPGCNGCTSFYQDCTADACYGDGQASICNTDQITQCTLQRDSCRADRSCYTTYPNAPAGCGGCDQYYQTCTSTACRVVPGHSSTCNTDQITLCSLQRDSCKKDRSCVDPSCQYIQGFGGSSGDSLCQAANAGTCTETTPGGICSVARPPNNIFWAKCCTTPEPAPSPITSPTPTVPPCGNGICDGDENAATCMSDCPNLHDYSRTEVTTYSCQRNKCEPTIRYCDTGIAQDGTCQPSTTTSTPSSITGRVTEKKTDIFSAIINFFLSLFGQQPAGMFSFTTKDCTVLPTENDRIDCYQQNCLLTGDLTFCQQISFPDARDQAYTIFATSRLQPAVCNNIANQQTKDHCLKAVTAFAKPEVAAPLTDTLRESRGEHFAPFALLDIFSAPEASVKVDSENKGQTPLTLELSYATHLLRLAASGYAPLTFPYLIQQRRASLMAILQPVVGRLTVTSIPYGATIFFNSRDRGQTPKEVALAPGTYELRVEKTGYHTYIHPVPVFVYAGQAETLSIPLVSTSGTLTVVSLSGTTPIAGATVFVNNENKGTTTSSGLTLPLPTGTYTVRVEMAGYTYTTLPIEQSVTIQPGLQSVLNFYLQSNTGTLVVYSTPVGASVFLNTETTARGTTTAQGLTLTLPVATYTIKVTKFGYRTPASQSASIERGLQSSKTFTLVEQSGTLTVKSNTQSADVYLGTTKIGTTSTKSGSQWILTKSGIKPGTHTVKVKKGSKEKSGSVTIEDTKTKTITLNL